MSSEAHRVRISLKGAVQGVGFRPFVYHLAREMGLVGWVINSGEGVVIEVEGRRSSVETFHARLHERKPALATVAAESVHDVAVRGEATFRIAPSSSEGSLAAWVMPDLATCDRCVDELRDHGNRRYRYPFINCTQCGPRYSILETLPYERARTTMGRFAQCAECQEEFDTPSDRRFHAEPNACPRCGPEVRWRENTGVLKATGEVALERAIAALRAGAIVAVKSLGGFHLMADAGNEIAVRRLRDRKQRPERPFALLYPTLEMARRDAEVSSLEARALTSLRAPIVLLARRACLGSGSGSAPRLASSVVNDLPLLGVMLPSNPIQHLILDELRRPLVATSGNLSEEPMVTDDEAAFLRLGAVADGFLGHNRPIARRADDSIVRIVAGRELVLRAGRGYAPFAWESKDRWAPAVASGGQMKNTVALSQEHQIYLSAHVGDLNDTSHLADYRSALEDFPRLYQADPETVAVDAHPGYVTGPMAANSRPSASAEKVFHHEAHFLSCLVDNGVAPPALGVTWDGSGWGGDGTMWGGEWLMADSRRTWRVGRLRRFRLPGGEKAVREPGRIAVALLGEAGIDDEKLIWPEASDELRRNLKRMIATGLGSPWTSSAGRLFDGVAAILGMPGRMSFEGQAAMRLEGLAAAATSGSCFSFGCSPDAEGLIVIDWAPMLAEIVKARDEGRSLADLALGFHWTLAEMIVAGAKVVGEKRVALTGGCFQNRLLTERAIARLEEEGFEPFWHRRVPPGDGGIALGQLAAVTWRKTGRFPCV